MNLLDESPYDMQVKIRLNNIQPGIWKNLKEVSILPEEKVNEILCYFIELACKAQNERNITLGREAISEMPRKWVIDHIEEIAKKNIDFEDEWEYRRLVELYLLLDSNLTQRLLVVGLDSSDPCIIEAARDFFEKL